MPVSSSKEEYPPRPSDGRVLMVAWQDAEALAATLETGEAHFHSRSRDALWRAHYALARHEIRRLQADPAAAADP